MHDDQLLEMRAEIALTDAMLRDAILKLRFDESSGFADRVSQAWNPLRRELRRKPERQDPDLISELVSNLTHVIGLGQSDAANVGTVRRLIADRRVLVESEQKRERDLDLRVPVEQVSALLAGIADVLQRTIPEAGLRRSVVDELTALVDRYGVVPDDDPAPAC